MFWNVKKMPTTLRIGPYRFYFYSYNCGEPRHIHVDREKMSAKFWLDPDVSLAGNYGFSEGRLPNHSHPGKIFYVNLFFSFRKKELKTPYKSGITRP